MMDPCDILIRVDVLTRTPLLRFTLLRCSSYLTLLRCLRGFLRRSSRRDAAPKPVRDGSTLLNPGLFVNLWRLLLPPAIDSLSERGAERSYGLGGQHVTPHVNLRD